MYQAASDRPPCKCNRTASHIGSGTFVMSPSISALHPMTTTSHAKHMFCIFYYFSTWRHHQISLHSSSCRAYNRIVGMTATRTTKRAEVATQTRQR